jgi:spermidine synthase
VEPDRRHYGVVFGASLGLLMLELAVARTLSVALLSHFAFVAISLAMFGLGLAGLVVYLRPDRFPRAAVDEQLVRALGRFGLWAALGVMIFLRIHVIQELSPRGFASLSAAYLVLALPFFFAGLCVTIAFTHFSSAIGRLYAADLIGASLGCLGAVVLLGVLPAPVVPLVVGVGATAAAFLLARRVGVSQRVPFLRFAFAALVLVLALGTDVARMRYVKNWEGFYSEAEAWNVFSRISVIPNPKLLAPHTLPLRNPPTFYTPDRFPASKWLDIDGTAWTPMFRYDGNPASVAFLRESAIYAVHAVRPNARVLIIGTGGGRDILAAQAAYGQPSVTGIEINPLMTYMVQERFGDYSGRPYTLPGVHVILGEGRSMLSGIRDTFDVIQLSLVDTFAAGAAGGFVFSENYLYTTEAFREYFRHLAPGGVLSMTRYFVGGYPLEMMRLVRMTSAAWAAEGATAGTSMVVLAQGSVATLLAKRDPWTPEELAIIDRLAAENGMATVYDPRAYQPGTPEVLGLRGVLPRYHDSATLTTAPTTDDAPYFFQFIRWPVERVGEDPMRMIHVGNEALGLMALLLGTVAILALAFFVGPLLFLARGRVSRDRRTLALLTYFVGLGFGFMMIEIPLLQRLVLFLGHPAYSLAVGLFSLLLFCGLGSLASERVVRQPSAGAPWLGAAIVGASLLYAAGLPILVDRFLDLPVALRIVIAVVVLAPIGLLLGMAYPVGIRILRGHDESLVPWAWGLNGATSVVASVAAVFVGAQAGFTWALLLGSTVYALGFLALATAAPARHVAAPERMSVSAGG